MIHTAGPLGAMTRRAHLSVAWPTVPSIASSVGYHTLAFSSDFTATTDVASNATQTSGAKWYWSPAINSSITTGSWSIATTTKATGTNASPNGGIITIDGVATGSGALGNNYFQTIPRGVTTVPAGISWQYFYAEFYWQLPSVTSSPTGNSSQWFPAIWSWSAQGAHNYNGGDWSALTATPTEIDFIECQAGVFGWSAASGHMESNIFYPGGQTNVGHIADTGVPNNNWHIVGALIVPSAVAGYSANTVYIFQDGVQQGTGMSLSSTNYTTLPCSQFMILGTGIGWPLAVDWFNVWVAP